MRTASWLLKRFGVSDALVGDLVEQHAAGRSRAWLWRQIAGAAVSALAGDLMAHPFRAAMTVLLGLAVRDLTIHGWAWYEPSIDYGIASALLDLVSLRQPAYVVAVGWANAILLAPAWFGIGFVVARLSRGAVLPFVVIALMSLLPVVTRQLEHTIVSDMVRWLLPVQLSLFGSSVGSFVLSTVAGAACGLGRHHELA